MARVKIESVSDLIMVCNIESIIDKAKSYKYAKCRNKYLKKTFGVCNGEVLTVIGLVELIKNVVYIVARR